MKVDINSLGIPSNYLVKCGIYFSTTIDIPFIYVVKENVSCSYPYRFVFYHGVFEYAENWTLKDMSKKLGTLLNDYNLDFSSFNLYNGNFGISNYSPLKPDELSNFMHNVQVTMSWQKKSALIRKLNKLDDLLR